MNRLGRVWASPSVRAVLLTGVAVAALLVTFYAGMVVGARQAVRALGSPLLGPFLVRSVPAPFHGTIGEIVEIGVDRLLVLDMRTEQPQVVRLTGSTSIERGQDRKLKLADLSLGVKVMVLGVSEEGVLRARFVRVLVPPPEGALPPWLPVPFEAWPETTGP